jgi:2-iminobutanoate/2-iminopropanoate deaminase
MKTVISTTEAPAAIGPYSQGIASGSLCFVPAKFRSIQSPATWLVTVAVLGAQGIGLENVVKTTVFMTDLAKFDEMNIVYARFFTGQPPARSTIQVAALPKGANVEIEAIAVKPS